MPWPPPACCPWASAGSDHQQQAGQCGPFGPPRSPSCRCQQAVTSPSVSTDRFAAIAPPGGAVRTAGSAGCGPRRPTRPAARRSPRPPPAARAPPAPASPLTPAGCSCRCRPPQGRWTGMAASSRPGPVAGCIRFSGRQRECPPPPPSVGDTPAQGPPGPPGHRGLEGWERESSPPAAEPAARRHLTSAPSSAPVAASSGHRRTPHPAGGLPPLPVAWRRASVAADSGPAIAELEATNSNMSIIARIAGRAASLF